MLLPLFPLRVVLFPRTLLPLHIFEERYKEMMAQVIETKSEFGVVQATDQGIVSIGCTATVERVLKSYPDGRLDLLTLGKRRFEIGTLNEEMSFLRGEVEFFDDEDDRQAPEEVRARAIESFSRLTAAEETLVLGEPDIHDPMLSFQLAQRLADLDLKQLLLSSRSEADRIQKLTDFLPRYVVKQEQTAHVKAVAPRNGHGHTPFKP